MKLLMFFFALILSAILLPLGLAYNILTIFKLKSIENVLNTLLAFLEETYNFFYSIAIFLDRLGNILLGSLFEKIVLNQKIETTFGDSGYTISYSFGDLLFSKKLNKTGISIVKFIDKLFGKNHCLNTYINS